MVEVPTPHSDESDLANLIATIVEVVRDEDLDGVEAEQRVKRSMEAHRSGVSMHAFSEFVTPVHVARFVTAVIRELAAATVVDPYANAPVLIASVALLPTVSRALGVVVRADLVGLNDHLRQKNLTLEPPSRDGPLQVSGGTYEWAVSCPPLGMRSWERFAGAQEQQLVAVPRAMNTSESALGHGISVRQASDMGELLPIALNLDKISEGFIVQLPESFFWSAVGTEWRTWLADRGYFPFAAVAVSKGVSGTNLETTTVAFGRQAHPKLWVGRLEATSDIDLLARNFARRTAKGPIEFGTLTSLDEFRTWSALLASRRVESWARKRNVPMAHLGEIAAEIGKFRATEDNDAPNLGNCIYFDGRVLRPVRTAPYRPSSERTTHVNNYFVQLDPSIASAEFLAAWFASDLGVAALEGYAIGAAQRRLAFESLEGLNVPLPSISQQEKYLQVRQRITSVAAAATEALDALGTSPAEPLDVEVAFEQAIEQDALVAWMKRLPYPLAAIFEVHLAETDTRARYDRLLFFFEALVEFGADLLLSILRRDDDLWASAAPKLVQEVDGRMTNPLRQVGFGGLLHVCFNASKILRKKTDAIQDPDVLRQITGISDKGFVQGLINPDLWNACRDAGEVRNNFTQAHAGDVPLEVIEREMERLLRLIDEIRPITFEIFKKVEVILPGPGSKLGAQRIYKGGRRLVGPSNVFTSRPLNAHKLVDLEATRLAIVERGPEVAADALELTGFVRLGEQPRGVENVAFFYNRGNDSEHFFRCFQTDGQPTAEIFDPILEAAIKDIDPPDLRTGS